MTPRRWLAFCNPPLRQLITETLGNERWINDTERLKVGERPANREDSRTHAPWVAQLVTPLHWTA